MDLTILLIFLGFFLTGIVAGIPIGQAIERRPKRGWPKAPRTIGPPPRGVFSKREIEDFCERRAS
jgi:hypothetical protein